MSVVVKYDDLARAIYNTTDLDPDRVIRSDYSGRVMYGRTCFGLTVEHVSQAVAIMVDLALNQDKLNFNVSYLAKSMSMDSMGLGTICYFPGWKTDKEEGLEEDWDED
jgi:hypothetical protein